jgi:hypothetical protein
MVITEIAVPTTTTKKETPSALQNATSVKTCLKLNHVNPLGVKLISKPAEESGRYYVQKRHKADQGNDDKHNDVDGMKDRIFSDLAAFFNS